MKKTILFAVMIMAVTCAKAQLEMTSAGKLNLNSPSSPSAQMNIESSNTNIKGVRTGPLTSGYAPVLEGLCCTSGSHWAIGVRGTAFASNGAVDCGLFGYVGDSGSHKSYGVFGGINSQRGAAIYGQAYAWTSSCGAVFSAPYAGYFDGNVHIQGNLNYTGTLLTTAPNPSGIQIESLSTTSKGTNATTNRLQAIDVQSFYHTAPLLKERPTMTDKDMADMDSIEVEAIKRSLTEDEVKDVIADQIYAKQHYALNVNQLEEVFPDLVYDNEDGTKSINYVEMVPILVQAINELSTKVEELEGNNAGKKAVTRGTSNIGEKEENVVMLSLGQNKPNPFGTTTSIDVCIPEDVQKAFIYIYDLQGKKIDQVDITARGKQTVQLNAATLSDGMFLYSLIADGKVVETRRMIVEK